MTFNLLYLAADEVRAVEAAMNAKNPTRMCLACRGEKTESYFSMCNKSFQDGQKLTCNECVTLSPNGTGFFHQGLDWIPESSCFGVDTETSELLFFPKSAQEIEERAWDSMCSSCPVRQQCKDWGELTNGQGVFGGEFRTFDSDQRKPVDRSGATVGGNKPGWRLLAKGECRKGHPVLTEKDLHVRTKNRNGVVVQEGECYRCFLVTRNKINARRTKEKRSAVATDLGR